jgi:hypothetical protein
LTNGVALAECHGLSAGQPSGPRATAWGLLSVSTFLIQEFAAYMQHSNMTLPKATILNNNTKLTSYLHHQPTYPTLFCNATLANNWDILEQTYSDTQQVQLIIEWETVILFWKKHQQQTPPPFNLEQSIADTREQTQKFLSHNSNQYPFSPFLLASQCRVYSESIHSQYNNNFLRSSYDPTTQDISPNQTHLGTRDDKHNTMVMV